MMDRGIQLLPEETIIFQTKKHKIIFFMPCVMTIFGLYLIEALSHVGIMAMPWAVAFLLFFVWAQAWLTWWTSNFCVTNKRVLMKEGFFFQHAADLRMAAVTQVSVNQSLIGRILNYGTVTLNAMGAFDAYGMIAQPLVFQRQVNEQLDRRAP